MGFHASAQQTNVTSAALEYKKFQENFAQIMMGGEGDLEAAKKSLNKAKGFIDLASEHKDTKDHPKMLYYKGEIYTGLLMANGTDTVFMKTYGEEYLNTGLESYKRGYAISDKFDQEILSSINMKKAMFGMAVNKMYEDGMFKEAAEGYDMQVKLSDAVGVVDSSSIYNAGLCAERAGDLTTAAQRYKKSAEIGFRAPQIYAMASSALRKDGKKDEAKQILAQGRKKYPTNKDILFELVNTNLEEGDNAAAEASLAEAIAADPNNKNLHYAIGTIYIDLKQNDKAEAALKRALEIDPQFTDAQYQLGAHLAGIADKLREDASRLKMGDPNYDKMMAEADEYYKKSLVPLEQYIQKVPNDKNVLTFLYQIHRKLKNTEKSAEYKKRADAL